MTETPRQRPRRDLTFYGVENSTKENIVQPKKKMNEELELNSEKFNSELYISKLVEFKSLKEITTETVNIQKGFYIIINKR
jgi:hypothetical protein